MSLLESALTLSDIGFHVFPIVPGTKLPAIKDFPNRATPDQAQIGTLEQLEQNLAMCLLSVPACRCSPPAAGGERWVRPDRPK